MSACCESCSSVWIFSMMTTLPGVACTLWMETAVEISDCSGWSRARAQPLCELASLSSRRLAGRPI